MRIAFYAPMKPPDHQVPSGDREMARNLMAAMRAQGDAVEVASRFVSYSSAPSSGQLDALKVAAADEAARLLAQWQAPGAAPQLWMTYHPYYKSPDLLGPSLCRALNIPYVTAEASYAGKRDRDAWAPFQAEVVGALRQAAVNFAMTAQDQDGLARLLGARANVMRLPPFIDMARFTGRGAVARQPDAPAELVCAAMMRAGAKVKSYEFLAAALTLVAQSNWRLTIIGDGPERGAVEAAFAKLPPGRTVWRGAAAVEDIPALLAAADIYVWPGFDEAFGVAYLEAQAAGLPVVALNCGGVADAMRAGETGILVEDSAAPQAYAEALARLITDLPFRQRLGSAARRFMQTERSLAQAGALLQGAFTRIRAEPAL